MRRSSLVTLFTACLFLAAAGRAQEQTILRLETDSAEVQTGQEYAIRIRLDGAIDAWLVSVEISYDPNLLYVIGARAGSPVQQGEFFTPGASVVIRNDVQGGLVRYIVSMLGDVEPLDGSGVVGMFRVYPLAPGRTQLRFSRAEVVRITTISDQGTPRAEPAQAPFTPVLLELNISGSPVEPPSEATATPRPTESPTPDELTPAQFPTQQPTLVNVTAAPRTPAAAAAAPGAAPVQEGQSPLLPLAVGLVVFSALGLIVLAVVWRRSQRR